MRRTTAGWLFGGLLGLIGIALTAPAGADPVDGLADGLADGPAAGALALRGTPLQGSTLERIEAAYRTGAITHDDYTLYRAYRVLDRARLPAALVAPAADERPVRCATPLVRDALAARPWLSARGRDALAAALGPPRPSRYTTHHSANFQLIVGDDVPVAQSVIDDWLAILEHVWSVEVDQADFEPPPCTNQYYFDVYLANTGDDVPELETDVYGYVSLYNTDCPYMVVHAEYPWQADPTGAAQVTAAHEFLHGVQAGYDWNEADWWMESTAVWAEELVYPAVDDYQQYINGQGSWLEYPELALEYEGGTHEYGDVVWVMYLDENHGGSSTIEAIWDRAVSQPALQAIDTQLAATGSSLDDAYLDFAVHLALGDFVDAAGWDEVWSTEVDFYPVQVTVDQYPPETYGSSHVHFVPDGVPAGELEIEFEGEPSENGQTIDWGVAVIALDGGAPTTQLLSVDGNGDATATVADFGGAVTEVKVAAAVLGPSGHDPGDGGVPYVLTAYHTPYGDDDDDDDATDDDDDTGDDDTADDDDDDVVDDDDDDDVVDDDDDDAADDDDDDDAADDDDDDDGLGDGAAACACAVDRRAPTAPLTALAVLGITALARRRAR